SVRGILSRHSGAGPTAVSLLWLTCDRDRDAWLADRACRTRLELRCIRITGLSRFARGDSEWSVGGGLLTWDGTNARLSPHHPAAGVSHCPAADDKRLRVAIQRYFSGFCDLGVGVGNCVSRAGERVRTIPVAWAGGVGV